MIGLSISTIGKECNEMSLVGMKICDDGIIAFADSKASRINENNIIFEDIERGNIKKIFKHKNFVLVTSGNNEIISNGHCYYIEELINDILEQSESYIEFLEIFRQKANGDDRQFNFIIGYKKENEYIIQPCQVKNNQINYNEPLVNNKRVIVQGENRYVDMFTQMTVKQYNTVEKAKEGFARILNSMICIFDHYNCYNSVGGDINMEIFE